MFFYIDYERGPCYRAKEREGSLQGHACSSHCVLVTATFCRRAEVWYFFFFEKWLIDAGLVAHLVSLMLCIYLAFIPTLSRAMALLMWRPCICAEQSLCSHGGSPAHHGALGTLIFQYVASLSHVQLGLRMLVQSMLSGLTTNNSIISYTYLHQFKIVGINITQ